MAKKKRANAAGGIFTRVRNAVGGAMARIRGTGTKTAATKKGSAKS